MTSPVWSSTLSSAFHQGAHKSLRPSHPTACWSRGHLIINGMQLELVGENNGCTLVTNCQDTHESIILMVIIRKYPTKITLGWAHNSLLWQHVHDFAFYMPDESWSYYGMARVICPSVNIWVSTGVTTCRINFNFTDIIHPMCQIHDTGNGPSSSLDMCILTQLLIFAFWLFLRPFSS